MNKILLTFVLITSFFSADAYSKEWKGIVPCVSTRSDVEKTLGKDRYSYPGVLGSYIQKAFHITVYYDRTNKGDSDNNVVKQITVYRNKSELLAAYIKNIPHFYTDFVRTEENPKISHVRYVAHYFNRAEGFELVVQKDDDDKEVITSFVYYCLDADVSKLSCE